MSSTYPIAYGSIGSVTSSASVSRAEAYVLQEVDKELYGGRLLFPAQESPCFTYRGPRLPIELWQQVLAWFVAHRESEVMIRFYLDVEAGRWHAVPFPQYYPTGMTVREIPDHPLRPQVGRWLHFGSAHHHCSARAFPSGTDDQDELAVEGLHLIVGDLDKAEFSLFWRFTVSLPGRLGPNGQIVPARRAFVDADLLPLEAIFAAPTWVPPEWESWFIRRAVRELLPGATYPAAWDEMLIPPPPPPARATSQTSYLFPAPAPTKRQLSKEDELLESLMLYSQQELLTLRQRLLGKGKVPEGLRPWVKDVPRQRMIELINICLDGESDLYPIAQK